MTELKDFLLDTLFQHITEKTEHNIHPKFRRGQVLDEWIREYDDLWERWQEGPAKIADKLIQIYPLNRRIIIDLLNEFFKSARPILAEIAPMVGERICMNENCLRYLSGRQQKWCSTECGVRWRNDPSYRVTRKAEAKEKLKKKRGRKLKKNKNIK